LGSLNPGPGGGGPGPGGSGPGPDGTGGPANPTGGTEDTNISLPKSSLQGRTHVTQGGGGSFAGFYGGIADQVTVETRYRSYRIELVRDLYDFEHAKIGEEGFDLIAPADEFNTEFENKLNDGWRKMRDNDQPQGLQPYQHTEIIYGTPPTWQDAQGWPFWSEGPTLPGFAKGQVGELATEAAIRTLYEDEERFHNDPSLYWSGSVTPGNMGFLGGWTLHERRNYGRSPYLGAPEISNHANFQTGIVPDVRWSEYWLQADGPVPDLKTVERTLLIRAVQEGEEAFEEVATVTFTIPGTKDLSEGLPRVTGLSRTAGWVEARSDGTLLLKPRVARGMNRVVSLLPVELKMEGVAEEDEETDKNIVIINANNDNGSAWEADTNDTIPTTRDFDHGGGIGKDDEELKLVEVTAPDEDGIEAKIKISPSDKIKAWKGRDKTDPIGIGADGTLSFPNDEITDFYIEGIKVSDAKGEITMTMEVTAGQQNHIVDTIKFAVGPVYESLEVKPSSKVTLGNVNFHTFLVQTGFQDDLGTVRGARIEAVVDAPANTGNSGIRFVQNVESVDFRAFYSDPKKQNSVLGRHVPVDDVDFPVLDAAPPANTPQSIFYDTGYLVDESKYSVHDSPLTGGIGKFGQGSRKFDNLIWELEFSVFVVYAFEDGTIFPIASTKWGVEANLDTSFNDANGNGEEDLGERTMMNLTPVSDQVFQIGGSRVYWNGVVIIGDNKPGALTPPVANESLQPVDVDP